MTKIYVVYSWVTIDMHIRYPKVELVTYNIEKALSHLNGQDKWADVWQEDKCLGRL